MAIAQTQMRWIATFMVLILLMEIEPETRRRPVFSKHIPFLLTSPVMPPFYNGNAFKSAEGVLPTPNEPIARLQTIVQNPLKRKPEVAISSEQDVLPSEHMDAD